MFVFDMMLLDCCAEPHSQQGERCLLIREGKIVLFTSLGLANHPVYLVITLNSADGILIIHPRHLTHPLLGVLRYLRQTVLFAMKDRVNII